MHGMQNWNTWCVSEPSGSPVVIVAAISCGLEVEMVGR